MQNASRFPYSPATLLVSWVSIHLICRTRWQVKTVMRAQAWYWNELALFEAQDIDMVRGFPFAQSNPTFRMQSAVAMIHLVAVNPAIIVAGTVSLLLLPIGVLVLSVWKLVLRFIY